MGMLQKTFSASTLTPELPIDPEIVKTHGGNLEAAINNLIDQVADNMFQPTEENKFLEVGLRTAAGCSLSQSFMQWSYHRIHCTARKGICNYTCNHNLEQETGMGRRI